MGLMRKAVIFVILAVGMYYLNQFAQGPMCTSTDRIDGKIVIITGANTGIGKETAIDLINRGGKVYIACRSLERANAAIVDIKNQTGADDARIQALHLDLNSLQSVRTFVAEFKQKEKKLDILINNAGVMYVPQGKTEDGFEITFGVNHLGHFLLTHLLMDLLVAASPSRIINVSSMGHQLTSMDFDDIMLDKDFSRFRAYHQSKLANILFGRELAKRLIGTGVTVYNLHPGAVRTELMRNIAPSYLMYDEIGKLIFYYMTWPALKDEIHGAQTQICCAVDKNLGQESGYYYSDCAIKEPSADAQSDDSALKLWNMSVRLVKLNPSETLPQLR